MNGLHSPTSAERFFQQGREELEKEIERLNQPKEEETEILKIDPELLEQNSISNLGIQDNDQLQMTH